jgi:hypothetical protein
MTNTPNNIAGEEWEKRFQEIWAHIDTPENWSWIKLELKAFIHKTVNEAIARERERAARIVRGYEELLDAILDPSPDTSKES